MLGWCLISCRVSVTVSVVSFTVSAVSVTVSVVSVRVSRLGFVYELVKMKDSCSTSVNLCFNIAIYFQREIL